MARFTVEMDLGNADFDEDLGGAIERALQRVHAVAAQEHWVRGDEREVAIFDHNGNRIGQTRLEE